MQCYNKYLASHRDTILKEKLSEDTLMLSIAMVAELLEGTLLRGLLLHLLLRFIRTLIGKSKTNSINSDAD